MIKGTLPTQLNIFWRYKICIRKKGFNKFLEGFIYDFMCININLKTMKIKHGKVFLKKVGFPFKIAY